MTVVENGEALGYMDDAGILHGEVLVALMPCQHT